MWITPTSSPSGLPIVSGCLSSSVSKRKLNDKKGVDKAVNPFFHERVIMKIYTSFFIMIVFSVTVRADGLSLAADAASFHFDQNAAYVEVYYQVMESWSSADRPPDWTVKLGMAVFRNDSVYTNTAWTDQGSLKPDQNVITSTGRAYFLAVEGNYRIELTAENEKSAESDQLTLDAVFRPYHPDPVLVSDIELATQIDYVSKENREHPFYKNGLMISPNPSLVFGEAYPILYYYLEIYSLTDSIADTDVMVQVQILDQDKNITSVPTRPVVKKITNPAIVEVGQLGLFPLSTGEYVFHVSISTGEGDLFDTRDKPFYVFKKSPEAEAEVSRDNLFALSLFAEMEAEQVKQELEYTRYLMTDPEKKIVKGLTNLDARRKYLFDFWSGRDATPMTVKNENYEEFKDRITEADRRFTTMRREGWKTDRGRVFCIYGAPNDINRNPVTSERVPYEVWTYELIEGGVEFIFADLSGYNEYQLIHSTKQGEVYNPQYEDLILK
jgi:GWxTD domain-containing protein